MTWTLKGEVKSTTYAPELRRRRLRWNWFDEGPVWVAHAEDGKSGELVGWDLEKNRIAWRLPLGTELPERTFSHDGKRAVCLRGDGKTAKIAVTVYDGPSGKKLHEWELPDVEYQDFYKYPPMTLSGDGKLLFVVGAGAVGRDVTNGREKVKVDSVKINVFDWTDTVAISPDGKCIAITRGRSSLAVYDVKTSKLLASHSIQPYHYPDIRFSPEGKRVAAGVPFSGVFVCDAKSDAKPLKFAADQGHAMCLAFSPNGASLAAGYTDGTAIIWDLTAK